MLHILKIEIDMFFPLFQVFWRLGLPPLRALFAATLAISRQIYSSHSSPSLPAPLKNFLTALPTCAMSNDQ